MLKINLLLVVAALLAIKQAQSNAILADPLAQGAANTLNSQYIAQGSLPESDPTLGNTNPAAGNPDINTEINKNTTRKRVKIYPVDLIAKSKGCISLEHFEESTLVSKWLDTKEQMTLQACWRHCLGAGTTHAAISKGNECVCTNTAITPTTQLGVSNKACTGNHFQQCGSDTCADFYILKMNRELLRHSLRNLEASNIWVYKYNWTTWVRTNDGQPEFALTEVLPTSNAIINLFDCEAQPTPQPNCQNFYAVLNGFEDFLATSPLKGVSKITPIDAEYDIVFAFQKNTFADPDVLLFRKSLCEWVLKVDEEIKEEFVFVNFEVSNRALVLVDKYVPDRMIKITSEWSPKYNTFREFYNVFNQTTPQESFRGQWFNKVHSFKNYFRDFYNCKSDITINYYQPPVEPAKAAPVAPASN